MATTSPDNIWTPDSGDDYALTVDLAATADTIQDALNGVHNALDPWTGDTGWVDLQGYLASGMSYVADGNSSLAGIRARRVGPLVTLSLGNFSIASINVPHHGNTLNTPILEGIPIEFRPLGGVIISGAWAGRAWSGYVTPDGDVLVATVQPSVTGASPEVVTGESFSGQATYLAGN